jgi:pimeloyl-ACP methyl ester carboxylesterase
MDPSPPTPDIERVERSPERAGIDLLRIVTPVGPIAGRLQEAEGDRAILWVFGAGGGLGGPAGGLYTRLGERLRPRAITSLELAYRRPGVLQPCVSDALVGLTFLESLGKRRIVLVGHSFGGAVVINAGAARPSVVAVAALSSQTAGTSAIGTLSPKPVLLAHGTADEVLPDTCSRELYARAGEPRDLILYPGCRHGLDECRDTLDRDLTAWLERVLGLEPSARG